MDFLQNLGFWCYVRTKCRYIILIEKLLLLRIFLQNKSFSNKIQKTILLKKGFPKTTLNNGPIVKSSWQSFLNCISWLLSWGVFKILIRSRSFWRNISVSTFLGSSVKPKHNSVKHTNSSVKHDYGHWQNSKLSR